MDQPQAVIIAQLRAEVAALKATISTQPKCASCMSLSAAAAVPECLRVAPELLSHCSELSAAAGPIEADKGSAIKPKRKGVRKRTKEPAKKVPGQSRYWTPEEHRLFLEALNMYGHKDLKGISAWVGTRNMTQVRTHSQKYFMRLMREAKRQNPTDEGAEAKETKEGKECAEEGKDGDGKIAEVETEAELAETDACVTTPSSPENEGEVVEEGTRKMDVGEAGKEASSAYSVPSTCGMTLLCLVGQDTLTS